MDDDMTTTTVRMNVDLHWKFKEVAAKRRMLVKEAWVYVVEKFIEEYEDRLISTDQYKNIPKQSELTNWNEFKRREGLDEI